MCGICGIVNLKSGSVREKSLTIMMRQMKHRGPDDQGTMIDGDTGLGFVRLSILDLSSKGNQPMADPAGRFFIVHNGEVYNYIELRGELVQKGYCFRTNTDTEVVLYSYMEWGESCLEKFNGMWASVIYDKKTKNIFISRDRYGIKPFYYYLDENCFIFASEIPPILKLLQSRPGPDHQSIFDYLVFNRTDQTDQTFFRAIKKLPHGHAISIVDGQIKPKKWYDLKSRLDRSFENAGEFKSVFQSAVGLRLRSDVPVGVCLSGGLDSSSIVSVLLDSYQKNDLHTFSAVYGKGARGDESEYIREYRDLLKNMHFIRPSADTLFADMPDFVRAQGEPIPSTAPYAQFKVMELARENVVVTLDGQGADEQLAGYHYFFGFFFKDLLRRFRLGKLGSEIYHYLSNHKSLFGIKTLLYLLLPANLKTRARVAEKNYMNRDFVREYQNSNRIAENLYGSRTLRDSLIDHFEFKLEHLLKWEDRNSMWFSLESRVPFLDHRLVEKTLSANGQDAIQKGRTKFILRESMKGILPEKIRNRCDKIGFETPEDDWFRQPQFKSHIHDLLRSGVFKNRGIINTEKAEALFSDHLNRKKNISKEIWKWIHLDLWFREFIN